MRNDEAPVTREECDAILQRRDSRKACALARDLLQAMDKLSLLHGACNLENCPTCKQLKLFNSSS